METVKIAGVTYPVSYNMGAVIGVMKDSREVSLEQLRETIARILRAANGEVQKEVELQNDIFQLLQLGAIVIHNGVKNQCLVDGNTEPFARWEQVAAHLKSLRAAGKHIGLFYVALSELYAEDEDDTEKKTQGENTSPLLNED